MTVCCRYGIGALVAAGITLASLMAVADDTKKPKTDKFAGKTVKGRMDGMGLIRARAGNVPKVGQTAPEFVLKTLDGKQTIKLSQYKGKKPVVLVFGSYT